MTILEYLKGTPKEMALVSHKVLKEQAKLVNDYQELVSLKDKTIADLMEQNALLTAQKGGLEVQLTKLRIELKNYWDLPRIDTSI